MGLGTKLWWLWKEWRMLGGLVDVIDYRRVKKAKEGRPMALRVRALGDRPIFVRPGTTDALVLWDTFGGLYHLPPRPLRRDALILDLGANVGYTAAHFAVMCPDARVIAVEMDAQNAAMARHNLSQFFGRCDLIEAAVCAEAGEVSYGDGGDGEWAYSVGVGTKTARAITMADLMPGLARKRIDYLKMDIEGAEDGIFKADLSWLKYVDSLNIEVHAPADLNYIGAMLEGRSFDCRRHPRHPSSLLAVR